MKKMKITLLIVALVAVLAIASGSTYAWLTSKGNSGDIIYNVGDVKYAITKSQSTAQTVVPGQDLGVQFTIANTSTVNTNLRIKATITVTNTSASTDWTMGTEALTDEILITLGDDWVKGTDGLYYYKNQTDAQGIIEVGTNPISPIATLKLNGALVGNTYAKATITISFEFEAKQADHVNWVDMGGIDFSTGLAK